MAELNQEVKKVLKAAWTKESVFTEEEKQRVRNRIGTFAVRTRKKTMFQNFFLQLPLPGLSY
ncbi:hypothetical protein M5V91_07945 [Cytobacillus pseudoceanisediminis]|uniref:hypothetical protein n=1 Tax=Cytobacillus pseudoceanisediminis TaxID=3051614 RepID=UPI002185072F|nr:hypothetical protein [Cytobacillus pseudoceanisediminis]UQX55589.1 hypothetical protein M5V91_07945 [Cytobacillus pseudoceanisediminis]